MKVTLNWLKDFVDIDITAVELADRLVNTGFEVEEIIDQRAAIKGVVLGRIESIVRHPDADKLVICKVDVGSEVLQIVTGASNIAEGDVVPVATDGAVLPDGKRIKSGKLRGVASCGMMCSGEELGLSESDYKGAGVYGILIMNGEDKALGTDINDVLGYDDVILDVAVTANRGDCNSVLGIAGEVAAILNKPLKMPDLSFSADKASKTGDYVSVSVKDKQLCPRYMAAAVTDVKIAPSPEYIRRRLKAVGIRPISNLVDITNYVLTEIGQPMHAFDMRDIDGGKINVRRALDSEKIVALDGKEYTLSSDMLIIADAAKPCAIAGVMGGENSGIREDTQGVIFESAKFARDSVRRTSRGLGLRSDSSARYEKGVDCSLQEIGVRRALHLVQELGCGVIAQDMIDVFDNKPKARRIETSLSRINGILGVDVPADEAVRILAALRIQVERDGDKIVCIPPEGREDLENVNDLAEEVIRFYGYDKIDGTLMEKGKQTVGGKGLRIADTDLVKRLCVAAGYNEILTYSFVSPKMCDVLMLPEDDALHSSVELLNPLGEDVSRMRTTLAYSIISTLASNYLKSIHTARLYEVAGVYYDKGAELPEQSERLALGAYGKDEDFYTVKGVIENIMRAFGIDAAYERSTLPYLHGGRSADIVAAGGKVLGYIGEVHRDVSAAFNVEERLYIAELDIDMLHKYARRKYVFEQVSKFPPVERDLAIVVEEDVSAAKIIAAIKKAGGGLLKEVSVFDVYRNKLLLGEKKSVALNLVFRADDKTLTDADISSRMDRITEKLHSELGGVLR
ncbi:MAG: phenylalanine--tRNA ligase subunit beta [Clostridia bacterium]|nr:phenylalanine--tRNA ligase subunit beta [Clostridia bacterium]